LPRDAVTGTADRHRSFHRLPALRGRLLSVALSPDRSGPPL